MKGSITEVQEKARAARVEPKPSPMSVSLQQRLAEVAKEFEDQKFRQLDLYQRQLRKARDALHDKEVSPQLRSLLAFTEAPPASVPPAQPCDQW